MIDVRAFILFLCVSRYACRRSINLSKSYFGAQLILVGNFSPMPLVLVPYNVLINHLVAYVATVQHCIAAHQWSKKTELGGFLVTHVATLDSLYYYTAVVVNTNAIVRAAYLSRLWKAISTVTQTEIAFIFIILKMCPLA